jgi:hypothetical protein
MLPIGSTPNALGPGVVVESAADADLTGRGERLEQAQRSRHKAEQATFQAWNGGNGRRPSARDP